MQKGKMNRRTGGTGMKRRINDVSPVDLAAKVAQSESIGFNLCNDSGTQSSRGHRSVGMYHRRMESKNNRPTHRMIQTTGSRSRPNKSGSTSVLGNTGYESTRNIVQSSMANHIVCAISENLARETCVCSLDAASPTAIQVSKQGNGLTYAETLAYLEILKPDEIVLNEGRRNSQLARKVLELFNRFSPLHDEQVPVVDSNENQPINSNDRSKATSTTRYGSVTSCTVVKFISRSYFDQTKGAEILRRVSREETYEQSALEEYILLSSAHALIQYTQQCLGSNFSRKSVCFNICCGGKKRMTIDRSSLLQLEILVNSKTGKIKDTLIGTIDCTKTVVGSRLLRSSLMAPSTRTDTINARLDLVDVFLSDEDFFYAVMENLKSLPEVDRMLSNIALVPPKNIDANSVANQRIASKGISALVCIKSTLQALPPFASVLNMQLQTLSKSNSEDEIDDTTLHTGCSSLLVGIGGGEPTKLTSHHLLRAIHFAMTQTSLSQVLDAVTNVFTESTAYSRNANAMRHQECFALKCEETGMMSVLRKAFLANVDDIYRKADEYAEVYGFPVSVRYSTARGYFLGVPVTYGSTLPNIFLQPSRSGRFVTCTTEEITSLNSRAQDNVHDILLMTLDRIHEVLEFARSHYDSIASLCDAVALLDMCHSFADHVTLKYVSQRTTLPYSPFQHSNLV
jgi:DNA mismatch repair protein MSH4